MPQLDKVTYFTQVFWLIVVFLSLYVVVVFRYIPRLAFILKYREKIGYLKTRYYEMAGVEYDYQSKRFELVKKHMIQVRRLSKELTTQYETWHQDSVNNLNQIQFEAGNRALVENQAMYPAYKYMKENYLK